ncbi:MAG: hypothetical protein HOA66_06065 [Candidatus Marinimicrobia bacterium]|nr:hypothetical protein [Candidatus Neomarinimicrobiota bacterium]
MRIIAPMMILIMMTSTLAGCTGGDPDSGGEMDSDAINDLIDANLQDFINNTTITVNQEIHHHYYNNTTTNDYTVEYNNTTVNEGDSIVNEGDDNNLNEWSNTSYNLGGANFGNGVNGTVSMGAGMMFVAHLEFTAMDLFPEYNADPTGDRDNIFTYSWSYYDYLTNSNRTDVFTFSCSEFYIIGSQSNNPNDQVSFWEDSSNYWDAWNNEYNSTIADLLLNASNDISIEVTCNENYSPYGGPIKYGDYGDSINFFNIVIPEGYAIEYIQLDTSHDYYGASSSYCYQFQGENGTLDGCWDSENYQQHQSSLYFNYSSGPDPSSRNTYYGGWENITVNFDFKFYGGVNDYVEEHFGNGNYGYGYSAIWPTSTYVFTLYYNFTPVIPVE